MLISLLATVASGALASVGAMGLLMASLLKADARRRLSFKAATIGLTTGGLALMFASIAGWLGPDRLFGGLLMVLFGTGSGMPLSTNGSR